MNRLLLALGFLVCLSGQAQKTLSNDYKYSISEPYKVVDADDKYYLSGDGKVITVKIDGRDIFIQRFDPNTGNQLGLKEYEDAFPKNAVVERILFIGGRVILFYTQWDGDNKIEQLFAQPVDMDKGEFDGKAKLILKVQGKVAGSFSGRSWDFNMTDKFPVYRSFDRSKFLVEFRRIPEKKNDKKSFDKIGLVAFDAELNELSNREVTMPYTERRMDNLDFQLDNKGTVYLLNKVYNDDSADDKKSRKDEEANYHIELFLLKSGSSEFQITKIDNKDKFINALTMYDSPSGDMICAGFYSNGKGKNFQVNSDGIITMRIKQDGSFAEMKTFDIPVDLINQYESAKTKRRNEKKEEKGEGAKWTNLVLREVKIMDDGSVFMAGEQYFYVVSTHMTGNGGVSTTVTYHYNDILAAKIDASGQLAWMRKIPKQQVGYRGRGGMSFETFDNGTDHFLVFLDNVKNFDLPIDKTPAQHTDRKGGYLTAVRINDATGDIKKGSILNAREAEDYKLHQISMDRIVKTSSHSFLMEAYKKGKEDIMVKVELK